MSEGTDVGDGTSVPGRQAGDIPLDTIKRYHNLSDTAERQMRLQYSDAVQAEMAREELLRKLVEEYRRPSDANDNTPLPQEPNKPKK